MLQIRVGNFGDGLKKKTQFFYTSNNIVKRIKPPQAAGSHGQFEFH